MTHVSTTTSRIVAPLKIVLLAGDVVAAEVDNASLWERTLGVIISDTRKAKGRSTD